MGCKSQTGNMKGVRGSCSPTGRKCCRITCMGRRKGRTAGLWLGPELPYIWLSVGIGVEGQETMTATLHKCAGQQNEVACHEEVWLGKSSDQDLQYKAPELESPLPGAFPLLALTKGKNAAAAITLSCTAPLLAHRSRETLPPSGEPLL